MGKPEGVRVVRTDGTEMACELVHEGEDDEGMDVWRVTGVVFRDGDRIRCAVLPGRTRLTVEAKA